MMLGSLLIKMANSKAILLMERQRVRESIFNYSHKRFMMENGATVNLFKEQSRTLYSASMANLTIIAQLQVP
jgi:hypothetical protein